MLVEVEDKKTTLQEEFMEQIKAFAQDNSLIDEYKRFIPLGEEVLVKMFRFKPVVNSGLIGKTELFIESPLTGELKPKSQLLEDKIFPMVKVIKKGAKIKDERIRENSLYTVPYDEVVGEDWNPEFMFLMNTMVQQGQKGGLARVPDNMRQRIPKVEKNWDRYKFSMPDRINIETNEDRLVYLIPDMKLKALYVLEG